MSIREKHTDKMEEILEKEMYADEGFSEIDEEDQRPETQKVMKQERRQQRKNRRKNWKLRNKIAIVLSLIVSVIAIGYVGTAVFYSTHFFSKTVINGIDCSNKNVKQVEEYLEKEVADYKLTLLEADNKTEVIEGKDISLKYVPGKQVEKLIKGQNPFLWIESLWKGRNMKAKIGVEYDESALKTQIANLECMKEENQIAPVNAHPEFQNDKDIFQVIREGDVFLHHPYMSFDPVVDFVRQAAKDPGVLAIKQTLYRVSGHSPIIAALAQAAENGKQVSVLVELKARFDEENNIVWAKMLEKAGCHVIYGLVGLKTHSKITLVVRREETGIRRYVHLATGNYNDSTAKLYTDCGIFTCDERFGEDATAVFNMLSGYSEPKKWNRLIVAPIWMKTRFLQLIEREAEHAKQGKPAEITAKMNSLCDPAIIAALYYASSCGVQINLLVRGICCLRTGIPGISENIHVRSIVGEFLEHSRIFYFKNNGIDEIYMGSADWMPRNLDRRVEIVFPVEDERIKKEILHVLDLEFRDNVKAHILQPDGTYEKQDKRGKVIVNSQMEFCKEAQAKAKKQKHEEKKHARVFIPAEPVADPEE